MSCTRGTRSNGTLPWTALLHLQVSCRFCTIDFKEWRPSYKALALLEFLLTHGPEGMSEEFHCDVNVIRQLGDFRYTDDKGFDWGACMRSKSKRILRLLGDEEQLKDARAEALRISREIQGFGNLIVSPSASSSPSSSSSSRASRTWSFGSSYSWDCPSWNGPDEPNKREEAHHVSGDSVDLKEAEMHLWDAPVQESSCLLITKKEGREGSPDGWSSRLRLRLFGKDDKRVAFRSLSDVEKEPKKKFERQSSLGF
ncbi:ENTH domain [Musa troglodytarum]|uniref:ENTH domain n=1 Tax=Musa troglodytarum TaxID=320322 RepID=A0A9E7F2X7_9LILI|nr:ENTH domain [Musa troglodytarum]